MKSVRNCEKLCNVLVRTDLKSLNLRAVCILNKFCIFLDFFFFSVWNRSWCCMVKLTDWRTALTWHGVLSDSLARVTQLHFILCQLFLIYLPLPKATLRAKRMDLRIFSISLYYICNTWLCACWIPHLQTTFFHSKQQFIASYSFIMNIRLQLMPLESTDTAAKRYLKRKY